MSPVPALRLDEDRGESPEMESGDEQKFGQSEGGQGKGGNFLVWMHCTDPNIYRLSSKRGPILKWCILPISRLESLKRKSATLSNRTDLWNLHHPLPTAKVKTHHPPSGKAVPTRKLIFSAARKCESALIVQAFSVPASALNWPRQSLVWSKMCREEFSRKLFCLDHPTATLFTESKVGFQISVFHHSRHTQKKRRSTWISKTPLSCYERKPRCTSSK